MPLTNPSNSKKPKVVVFQPRKSWTHDFCLLSDNSRSNTPSTSHLSKLKDAGLGRRRIVFPDKKASFDKVKSVLETEYPKLKSQGGAFEFMRAEGGGSSRPLCLIPIPSAGYTIPYLKEMVGPSTLIYVRPMKSVISIEKSNVSGATSASPSTECCRCKERVPISNLRQHNLGCKPITTDTGESEEEEQLTNEVLTIMDDEEGPSKQIWSSQLKELFPDTEMEDLEEVALQSASMDEAAGIVLDKLSTDQNENLSLEELIDSFVKKNSLGYSSDDEHLALDRESFWMDIMKFYKKSISKPDVLKRELSISFKDEDGLDGGAMKVEFFSLALQEVKKRLFEGKEPNLIPIKDVTKGVLFQLAGVIISHSVSQQASNGFPALAPHIYAHIVGYPEDEIALLMKKEFIPLDASTSLLHELLTGLEACKSDADIQNLLEENKMSEVFWQLINSSRWPKEQLVNISTKDFLLQHLVHHELLTSRKNEIEEFKEGLKSLDFLNLISKNREICKVLFCAPEGQQIDLDAFNEMMLNILPSNFAEEQSHKWFLEYLGEEESREFPGDSRCRSLLQFWTGWSVVPFGGLTKRLKATFLPDDEKHSLPTVSACTATLRLPTVHSSKRKFNESMDIALKYGRVGFPNP